MSPTVSAGGNPAGTPLLPLPCLGRCVYPAEKGWEENKAPAARAEVAAGTSCCSRVCSRDALGLWGKKGRHVPIPRACPLALGTPPCPSQPPGPSGGRWLAQHALLPADSGLFREALPAPLTNPFFSLGVCAVRVSSGSPMAWRWPLTPKFHPGLVVATFRAEPFPEAWAGGALHLRPRFPPGDPSAVGTRHGQWCPGALTRMVLSGTLCSLCRRSRLFLGAAVCFSLNYDSCL